MAITNGYATLAEIRSELGNYASGDTTDDAKLEIAVEAASRQIDGWCGQRFYIDSDVKTRFFSAYDGVVDLSDGGFGGIATTTGLIVATDDNTLTYGTTWAASDYRLLPIDADDDGAPWSSLIASPVGVYTLPTYTDAVKITAKFGWPAVPTDVKKACLILAADLFKAKDAAFGVAGFSEMGAVRVTSGLNRLAAGLLARYRRAAVG